MDAMDGNTPAGAMRTRLLSRVAQSHRHESQFHTLRREEAAWTAPERGAATRTLWRHAMSSSVVARLDAHATLEVDLRFNQLEMVVLQGSGLLRERALRCGDAVLAPHGADWPVVAGAEGLTVYARRSRVAEPVGETVVIATLDESGWEDFCPGVRIRELCNGGERRSVLVKMRPGASVNAHSHGLEEECMMLAGEAFIGDTLLRSGDFQVAPQGSRHGAITTDVGALFFVHGSLDPAAYA